MKQSNNLVLVSLDRWVILRQSRIKIWSIFVMLFYCCFHPVLLFVFCCLWPEVWVTTCAGNRHFFRNPSWVGISMQKQWRKPNATVVSFSYLLKARDSQINFSFPWKARMFVLPLNTGLKFHESSPMHYRSGLPLKPYFSWKGLIGVWRPLRHF